jgi:hypothetical protein
MAKKVVEDVKVETVKPEEQAIAEPKIEVKQVNLGVSTINDHEQRLTVIEAKIAELTK